MSNPQRFFRHSRVVYNASLDAMIRLLSRNSEVVNFSGLKHSRSEARIVSGIICAEPEIAWIVIFPTAGWLSRNRRERPPTLSVGPGPPQVLRAQSAWRDRKSTRLNS